MSDPTTYAPPPQAPVDRSIKVPHLVFGMLFLGIFGIWALGVSDLISGEHLAVLGPAVLIIAGIAGLAASLASGRNRRQQAPAEGDSYYAETTATTETTHDTDPTEEIR